MYTTNLVGGAVQKEILSSQYKKMEMTLARAHNRDTVPSRSDQPCSTSLHDRASKGRGKRTIECALLHVNNLNLSCDNWSTAVKCLEAKYVAFTGKQTARVTETAYKNNLHRTRGNFQQISNNHHGAQGFALLAHSLLLNINFSFLIAVCLTTFAYLLPYSYTAFFKHSFNDFP